MKEYLFRGFHPNEHGITTITLNGRQIKGEWIEGYYTELPYGSLGATIFSNDDEVVCEDTKSYIIKVFSKQHSNYSSSNPLQVIECEKYEVIPETIGQYSLLKDTNGKKIFEGDILHIKVGHGECVVGKAIVYFDENIVQYRVRGIRPYAYDSEMGDIYRESDFAHIDRFEVIGNIHDNPELLEAQEC